MTIKELKRIHKFHNYCRKAIKDSNQVGCFYCCSIFSPTEIIEWTDFYNSVEDRRNRQNEIFEGQTPICPYCSIDSVLPEVPEFKITKSLLKEMYDYWFQYNK